MEPPSMRLRYGSRKPTVGMWSSEVGISEVRRRCFDLEPLCFAAAVLSEEMPAALVDLVELLEPELLGRRLERAPGWPWWPADSNWLGAVVWGELAPLGWPTRGAPSWAPLKRRGSGWSDIMPCNFAGWRMKSVERLLPDSAWLVSAALLVTFDACGCAAAGPENCGC